MNWICDVFVQLMQAGSQSDPYDLWIYLYLLGGTQPTPKRLCAAFSMPENFLHLRVPETEIQAVWKGLQENFLQKQGKPLHIANTILAQRLRQFTGTPQRRAPRIVAVASDGVAILIQNCNNVAGQE